MKTETTVLKMTNSQHKNDIWYSKKILGHVFSFVFRDFTTIDPRMYPRVVVGRSFKMRIDFHNWRYATPWFEMKFVLFNRGVFIDVKKIYKGKRAVNS